MEPERIVRSRRIYEGKVFNVRLDTVEVNGGEYPREIIEHPGAVAIVALDDRGNVILVRQYRSAAAETLLEIPAGGLEPGETPRDTAIREMQEEVGLIPENLIELGYFWVAGAYDTEKITVFLSDRFRESSLSSDPDEQIEIVRMPFAEALAMVKSNAITDAKTLIGLNWAAERLAEA